MSLANKVALVTGAAQGLGKALAKELLKRGASVSLIDLNETQGLTTLDEFKNSFGQDRVVFFKGNVTSREDMEDVFKSVKDKFGFLDIVINNAGLGGETGALWERTIDVNVKGSIRGTLLAIDSLRKDKGGRGGVIVNVSSMAGLNPNPCSPAYCASKSAIIHYSLSWAKNPELVANDVRINVLAPAFVDTPLMSTLNDKDRIHMPQIADMIVQRVGIMSVESVAQATMELVEPEEKKHGQVLTMSETGGKAYHPVG